MADPEQDWIRKRAYALWEEEGYPSGKDAEHWERAKLEYVALAALPAKPTAGKRKRADAPDASVGEEPAQSQPLVGKAPAKKRSKKAETSG